MSPRAATIIVTSFILAIATMAVAAEPGPSVSERVRQVHEERLYLIGALIRSTPDEAPQRGSRRFRRAEMQRDWAFRLDQMVKDHCGHRSAGPPSTTCGESTDRLAREALASRGEALAELDEIVRGPAFRELDQAMFWLGFLRCYSRDATGAESALTALVTRFPKSSETFTDYENFGAHLRLPGYAQWLGQRPSDPPPSPMTCPPRMSFDLNDFRCIVGERRNSAVRSQR